MVCTLPFLESADEDDRDESGSEGFFFRRVRPQISRRQSRTTESQTSSAVAAIAVSSEAA